jgi:hypothetical protein
MNTSRRVPGVSRNSGWQAIDAEIAPARRRQQQTATTHTATESGPCPTWLVSFVGPVLAEQHDG